MDIELYQKNDFPFGIAVTDPDGVAINLTGASLVFTLKTKDALTFITTKQSSDGGITVDNVAGGEITVNLSSTDMDIEPGEYLYELLYIDANSKRYTTLQGGIRIIKSISA